MSIKIPEIGIGMLGCGFISRLYNDSLIILSNLSIKKLEVILGLKRFSKKVDF